MAIELNKGVNVHNIGDANDVLSTSTPNDVNSQGISKAAGDSGIFVISNADLEVWFHYDDGNGTLLWALHNTLNKSDLGFQDGHAVAWRNHKSHGTVTAMYLKATSSGTNGEDPVARTMSISKVIITDADNKDSELKKDFLNWYSNPIVDDLPGQNAAEQAVNYDGYERIYHDLSSHSIGDTYSFTVHGYVDSALTFVRMVDKIDCSYQYDEKTDQTTISFQITDGEYGDYHTTLDTWHTWWSLGEAPKVPFKMTIEVPAATGLGTLLQQPVSAAIMTYVTMNTNQVGETFRVMSTGFDLGNVGDQLIFVSNSGHGTIYATMTSETTSETTFTIDSIEVTPSQFQTFESQFSVYALPTVSFDFPIVMKSGESFSIDVNWGDGSAVESLTEADFQTYNNTFSGTVSDTLGLSYSYESSVLTYSHTYTSNSNFQIEITPNENHLPLRYGHVLEMAPSSMVTATSYDDFRSAQLAGSTEVRAKSYIRSIDQWGSAILSNMSSAFERCMDFDVLANDIPKFGTDANIAKMFKLCENLSDDFGSIEKWDTSDVLIMDQLFAGVRNFSANIDTKLATNSSGTEYLAWNTSNVQDFDFMFAGCMNFGIRAGFNQPISNWNMNNASSMSGMFAYCKFNQDLIVKGQRSSSVPGALKVLDVDVYNANNVYMNGINNTITTDQGGNIQLDGSNGNAELIGEVGDVVVLQSKQGFGTIKAVISSASSTIVELVVRSYNITVTTDEEEEGFDIYKTEFGSAPDWTAWYFGKNLNGGSATLHRMFAYNIDFNSDISTWYLFSSTTGSVTLKEMFLAATGFNQPLAKTVGDTDEGPYMTWDATNVTNVEKMFSSASLFNQDIGDFLASHNAPSFLQMFKNARDYNNAGQSLDWDTSSVFSMESTFENASSFNINISNWDVSNVTTFQSMFEDASEFNQDFGQGPAGSGPDCWDTSSGQKFNNMFQQCIKFNQRLFFDVRNAYSMSFFLDGASMFSKQLDITFGNGGNYVAGESIGPQTLLKDPSNAQYLGQFMRGTNYGTAEIDALLVKLVGELQNLNTITHNGHYNHSASDGNSYEGRLEFGLPAHTANSAASTARFGLIQNGWWVEDNSIITPVPNNISFDISGWTTPQTFSESALVNTQVTTTFTLQDSEGNYNGADFTLEYEDLTNINGDSRPMEMFELVTLYGGTAFGIRLLQGFAYLYNSSWNDSFVFHFKISTPNGSFRHVTRNLALTNEKPDGVTVNNMIDLGFPARNTNLLTSASQTTLTFSGYWNTTPYGILKPKFPLSGHLDNGQGTYGDQYLGAGSTGLPNWDDRGTPMLTGYSMDLTNFNSSNLPPTWPNVVAGPYIHIKRSRFNSENDYEQFNTVSNPYNMYIADITEWVNGAADQDGIDTREGVEVELVGVDMDMGWWVQPGGSTNTQSDTTANYFCEFRSSPLPAQARQEIDGHPDRKLLSLDFWNGWNAMTPVVGDTAFHHYRTKISRYPFHNINNKGYKNVTNWFKLMKHIHTNPITGEDQDHWEISYNGPDIGYFPTKAPDNFTQSEDETKTGNNSAWDNQIYDALNYSSANNPYIHKLSGNTTHNHWRKGVQFTIWYRFRDASNSTLMFGSDHGAGNKTDDDGLYSGTLKKICLVVRDSLK